MRRAWIMQANPVVWRVWDWWEQTEEPLDHWTISQHLSDIAPQDDFALWIAGRYAGVYAVGRIAGYPGLSGGDGGFWVNPTVDRLPGVALDTTRYLFDDPVRKAELQADPEFRESLILRMPRTANPIPVTPTEWAALRSHVGRRGRGDRVSGQDPIVSSRPIGDVPEDVTVATYGQEQNRTYREAQLLRDYQRFLDRPLECRAVRLRTGERLVCDAYDAQQCLLIEAKASASRQDVRMAIGQLFDYRRHVGKRASLAVLLPELPSTDLLDLLTTLGITAIVKEGSGAFTSTT